MTRALKFFAVACACIAVAAWLLSFRSEPQRITYGASFNKLYADELGLDWREAYRATLDDLGVRHLRLSAHWPMIEPERDRYSWADMDFQISEAKKRNADIILAVGRRLPRWPECHIPRWIGAMSWEEQKMELRQYLTAVIERYRSEPAIVMWQVENEPFLSLFAYEMCGDLDIDFLREEIALVKSLDPTRPVLVTDSGNLGTWVGAYRAGDAFGTSLYIYFWNPEFGQFKTRLPAAWYRIKTNLMRLLLGNKPVYLIELSLEPWLIEPLSTLPLETQLSRMDMQKFGEIVDYARKTRFDTQYLWGVEWWYYLKTKRNHSEFWDRAKALYAE